MGLSAMDCFNLAITGPYADTPAKPAKKANVIHVSAAVGLDWA
jgi:hypothetical protein